MERKEFVLRYESKSPRRRRRKPRNSEFSAFRGSELGWMAYTGREMKIVNIAYSGN
jgi:hypothetical protein